MPLASIVRLTEEASATLTATISGATIEVHRARGSGLLESAYEAAFCHELELRSLTFDRQVLTYLRLAGCRYGLRLNVGAERMVDGVTRLVDGPA